MSMSVRGAARDGSLGKGMEDADGVGLRGGAGLQSSSLWPGVGGDLDETGGKTAGCEANGGGGRCRSVKKNGGWVGVHLLG